MYIENYDFYISKHSLHKFAIVEFDLRQIQVGTHTTGTF